METASRCFILILNIKRTKIADNDSAHATEPKIMPTNAPVLKPEFEEALVPATILRSIEDNHMKIANMVFNVQYIDKYATRKKIP